MSNCSINTLLSAPALPLTPSSPLDALPLLKSPTIRIPARCAPNQRAAVFFSELSLAQGFLPVSDKRRQQIADDPAGAGLNFHSYCHPRFKASEPVFHRNLHSIQ